MSAPARWPNLEAHVPDLFAEPTDPTPLHDALAELPTANVWRAAYLRGVIARLSGGGR